MYIDFHTHAFADKIAQKAIARLESVSNLKAYTDGTVGGLKRLLAEDKIDKAVFLPIATKPSQQEIINNLSASLNSDDFICFGSVHPDSPDALNELERIKALGLKGVKFHPDYQEFFVEDEKMLPIYKKCEELGLIVVFHAGYDPLSPDLIHCLPQPSAQIAKRFPNLKIVLAHLGGMYRFEDVYNYVAGLPNVWLDTAFLASRISDEMLEKIIRKHGADKVLLASDAPWQRPADAVEQIQNLPLSDTQKEWIFHKSAEHLLNL